MGEVHNKSIFHLQCYFGLEVLNLARMGANVTGSGFFHNAISKANDLKTKLNLDAQFICSDVYNASKILDLSI